MKIALEPLDDEEFHTVTEPLWADQNDAGEVLGAARVAL